MKVAILLNGFIRNSINEYNLYKSLFFDHLDCDIFMFIWDVKGMKTEKLRENRFTNESIDKNQIKKVFKPLRIKIGNITEFRNKYKTHPVFKMEKKIIICRCNRAVLWNESSVSINV